MNNIYGVILGAGEGTRMKSCLPKVLHKAAGKELIFHVADCIKSLKPSKLFVIVGSGCDKVTSALNAYDKSIETVLQKQRLGSGHALLQLKTKASGLKGHLLVMCGDTPLVRKETIATFVKYHVKSHNSVTVLSGTVTNPFGYGRIVRNDNGSLKEIVEEKSATELQKKITEINSGIYCFDLATLWQALSKIKNNNSKKEYYLTDAISILNNSGHKTDAVCLADEQDILGINDRKQLAVAEKILRLRKLDRLMQEGVTIIDTDTTYIDKDVTVGQDTVIMPNTFIKGSTKVGSNCKLGPDTFITNSDIKDNVEIKYSYIDSSVIKSGVKIGPFSHIRPSSVLGENVKVGNFSEVKKSQISAGSKINHLSYIGDANIGKNVNVGAGTITCNYDGINKHKTVVGDEVFVGSNVNLVAPVKIGKKVLIAAGSTITENVLPNKLVIARARQVIKVRKKN